MALSLMSYNDFQGVIETLSKVIANGQYDDFHEQKMT